ncbi:glutamate--cysteine ligase [Corynebacterium sp. 13CS0277]|uniref:glutamate--cysteine ligase n=1 Tax=Corynebacterium sp. 13CS0277 TaxID=2071994 RepID=UPI000D040EF2|nr:glutamate--cysteine ligase [Corynebacterium sp. 13CS0277]PRQ10593.1 glutamate--cysteine ligase [Corynebacterium sp. 13CS0277]
MFTGSPRPTLGVEWELALVDPATGDLVPRAEELIDTVAAQGLPVRLEKEFLANTIEIVTGVCDTAGDAVRDIRTAHRALEEEAARMGVALWTSGSHPTTDFRTQPLSTKPHYAEILERTQYWGKQMLIWGLHVHVGVRDKERVWPIIDGLMTLMPVMLAYSASSPAWMGDDTGYASNRSMLYQQLPTAGIPYAFDSWADYESFMRDQEASGVVSHTGSMHFDIRPACEHGTIEVRVCDAPTTLWELSALVAFMHCAVVYFDRLLDAGRRPPQLPYWHHVENKWRAARYGDEALIITDADTNEALVGDVLEEWVGRLEPVAQDLGCVEELNLMRRLRETRPGFARQRDLHAATGDWAAVVHATVAQLRAEIDGTER